jgi:hypothetical protein
MLGMSDVVRVEPESDHTPKQDGQLKVCKCGMTNNNPDFDAHQCYFLTKQDSQTIDETIDEVIGHCRSAAYMAIHADTDEERIYQDQYYRTMSKQALREAFEYVIGEDYTPVEYTSKGLVDWDRYNKDMKILNEEHKKQRQRLAEVMVEQPSKEDV